MASSAARLGLPPFSSMNSMPAASSAGEPQSFAAVIEVVASVSSALRMVVTLTATRARDLLHSTERARVRP